jgi:hypothetical protein
LVASSNFAFHVNPSPTSPIIATYPLFSIEAVGILLSVDLHAERAILSLVEVDLARIAESNVFGVLLASVISNMPPTRRSIPRGGSLAMRIRAKLPLKHGATNVYYSKLQTHR